MSELICCEGCGRDTTNKEGLCNKCLPRSEKNKDDWDKLPYGFSLCRLSRSGEIIVGK